MSLEPSSRQTCLISFRCTTSVLSALKYFSKVDPEYRAADIE